MAGPPLSTSRAVSWFRDDVEQALARGLEVGCGSSSLCTVMSLMVEVVALEVVSSFV